MKQRHFREQRAFRFKRFARKAYSAFNSMHKVVSMGVVVGCALTCLAISTASAQSGDKQQKQPEEQEKELDEVMVTASRLEMPINQTSKLVTVITKEQLSQAPVQSFQDLLAYVASVDAIQRGGHGVQTDISIRGGSADQTAILLNGVNISNSQTGHYSLDIPLNISDIERIEILHGPSALVYGSSAFSGGINIITDKTNRIPLYAKVEGGMYNLRAMELRGATKKGKITNTLSVGYNSSQGYMDNTDYDIYNALLQTRIQSSDYSKLDIQLGYNEKKYGANSFYSALYPNQYDHTTTYMGSAKGEFGTKLKFIPIVYWNRHYDNYQLVRGTTQGQNFHRNDSYGANLILSYRSKLGNTTLGGEFRKDDILSTKLGKPMVEPNGKYTKYDDRIHSSLALEHILSIDKVSLSAGLLMNHNTIEKGRYTFYPSLSMSYRPVDQVSIYSSWSKSTRVPTFTDLSYSNETHEANEFLKPEKSESFDLGLKYNTKPISAYLTGYLMQGRDVIDWVKNSENKWASWNHTTLDKQGVEMGVTYLLSQSTPLFGKHAEIAIDYAYLHQTTDSKQLISRFSNNYLKNKFTARFNHTIYQKLSASWNFRYQKRMGVYEKIEEGKSKGYVPFPDFSTLNLRLNYDYTNVKFYVNFNNIYDTQYYDMGNIPQAGFWFVAGVSYTLR